MDAETIYDVPLLMRKEKLDERVLSKLKLSQKTEPQIDDWRSFLGRLKNPTNEVHIGLVGKYVELPDAYKSIAEAFIHAGAHLACKVNVHWISSETITAKSVRRTLKDMDGVLVAPGFGERGIEGKIEAIKYVRENNIPFFGICLGMQCAVVEFARNVLGLEGAASTELHKDTPHPVIDLMEDQKNIKDYGGTMRLGQYDCKMKKSKVAKAYGSQNVKERHRHRYEFNNQYLKEMEAAGLQAVGTNPDSGLVEIVELKDHPYFVGTQFHPELKSTVMNPHPLFVSFIDAVASNKKN